MKYTFMAMCLSLFLTACNDKSIIENKSGTSVKKPVTGMLFQGQRNGCEQNYDPLFCPPRDTLNSGPELENFRDEDSKPVILNAENSEED